MTYSVYFVSDKPQRNTKIHEVHRNDCLHLPSPESITCVGYFDSSHVASEHARKIYQNAALCEHCCSNTHETQPV